VASDVELIEQSLRGDNEAFVVLVRRHSSAISSYLARRAGTGPAEDLLGEVWVTAFGARSSYDSSFPDARPWLLGIARNVLRHHWRSCVAARRTGDLRPAALAANPWPEVDELLDGAAIVRQALNNLRPLEREVLLLVVWEQMSIADAARVLALPSGTARRYLHQSRITLREDPAIVRLLGEINTVKEKR
jgi:RNA polymerase sigma factor (sigma-70 family)